MQNRYVGDVGDFLKFGLLNFLFQNQSASPKFKLGVNWYLVPDEKNKADGKYTDYLKPKNRFSKKLQECNPKLYRQMNEIVFVKKKRNIAEIEKDNVLPKGTIFYGELLRYDNIPLEERERIRKEWHSAALKKLRGADVIFLDPDNGIETEKMSSAPKKSRCVSVRLSFGKIKPSLSSQTYGGMQGQWSIPWGFVGGKRPGVAPLNLLTRLLCTKPWKKPAWSQMSKGCSIMP